MAKVSVNKHQPVYQMPTNPAAVRTKKYALPTKTYIILAMKYFFKSQMKWGLIPLALILINAIVSLTGLYPNIWIYVTIVIGVILYLLFWLVQFVESLSWRNTSLCLRSFNMKLTRARS